MNLKHNDALAIGVLSDTHGYLSPNISKVFQNVDTIIHAGDIDNPNVLHTLRQIAPVVAVRGNMDSGAWAKALPVSEFIHVGKTYIYVIHDHLRLDIDPVSSDIRVVIFGHTHEPYVHEAKSGVIFLNPGSASLPRKGQSASVALLEITGDAHHVTLVDLNK
jgi:putative phosphoesterase